MLKDDIETLLNVGNDNWRDYILSSASALNFTIKDKEPWDTAEWDMVAKPYAMENWMENYYTESTSQDPKWEMGQWLSRIGLGGASRSHVTVPTKLDPGYQLLLQSRAVDDCRGVLAGVRGVGKPKQPGLRRCDREGWRLFVNHWNPKWEQ
jgi:hypothetical protein